MFGAVVGGCSRWWKVVPGFDFGEQGVSSEDGDVAGGVEDGDVWSGFERLSC